MKENSLRSDPLSTAVKTFSSDLGMNILIVLLTQKKGIIRA